MLRIDGCIYPLADTASLTVVKHKQSILFRIVALKFCLVRLT